MSLSSTSVTSTPQSVVVWSRISRMSILMLSVSDNVSSSVCWPTTFLSVVWAIWSMATSTLSIAITDFTASTTRKYATADTSTLTLSRVIMPCDWIGIVTIRSDTRRRLSTNGMMTRNPGSRLPMTLPSRNRTPCSYCFTILSANAKPSMAMTPTITRTVMMVSILQSFSDVGGANRAKGPQGAGCENPRELDWIDPGIVAH